MVIALKRLFKYNPQLKLGMKKRKHGKDRVALQKNHWNLPNTNRFLECMRVGFIAWLLHCFITDPVKLAKFTFFLQCCFGSRYLPTKCQSQTERGNRGKRQSCVLLHLTEMKHTGVKGHPTQSPVRGAGGLCPFERSGKHKAVCFRRRLTTG